LSLSKDKKENKT